MCISEAEVALDIAFKSEEKLLPICERLCRKAMLAVKVVDMAR